jgi:hypothetical protein
VPAFSGLRQVDGNGDGLIYMVQIAYRRVRERRALLLSGRECRVIGRDVLGAHYSMAALSAS